MTLTSDDLKAIGKVIDERLEEKLEAKLEEKLEAKLEEKIESKLDEKLRPIHEFINYAQPTLAHLVEFAKSASEKIDKLEEFSEFAEKALTSLLDESQENFEQKLPQRIKKLEDIHPGGHHVS